MRNRSTNSPAGGHQPGGTLEERLARRFQAELARAERDYPRLRFLADREEGRSFRRSWPRLQTVVIGVSALAIAGIVVASFAWRGQGGAAASGSAPVASGETEWPIGSGVGGEIDGLLTNGLPARVGGELAYQLWQDGQWGRIEGSFLLAGYKWSITNACPPGVTLAPASPTAAADEQLMPICEGVELSPTPGNYTTGSQELAPLGSGPVAALADGTAVVVRAHQRDPLALQCSELAQRACAKAVVVDEVVWRGGPGVRVTPDHVAYQEGMSLSVEGGRIISVNQERVYSPEDALPTTGPFLITGPIVRNPPSCPATAETSGPIVWPECGSWTFAGYPMVRTNADLDYLVRDYQAGVQVVLRVYGAGSTTVCPNGEPPCRVLAAVEVVIVVWRT